MKPIKEICEILADSAKRCREQGHNVDALYLKDEELERRMCEHLGVSEHPRKGFQARLFNALMDKYGKQV